MAPSLASGHLLFCHYKASTRILYRQDMVGELQKRFSNVVYVRVLYTRLRVTLYLSVFLTRACVSRDTDNKLHTRIVVVQCVRTSAETLDQWEVSGRCWWQQLLNASSVCFTRLDSIFFLDKFDRFYTVAIRVIGPRLIFFFSFPLFQSDRFFFLRSVICVRFVAPPTRDSLSRCRGCIFLVSLRSFVAPS